MQKKQAIVEAYPCLQSEGSLTGIPHILIRTTGCTLRCQFSDTDFCDSSYTSWSPEKGQFSMDDIIAMYKKHPQIKHTMITGGAPTMHKDLLGELMRVTKVYGHIVTLETEGSRFVATNCDLLSLSPKLSNSRPRVGTEQPNGKEVTEKHLAQHDKGRRNFDVMRQLIEDAKDYQLKPVISNIEEDMAQVKEIQLMLHIPNSKVFLMPAGGTEEELAPKRAPLMEYCWQNGYSYTDRIHITAYGDLRGY